jgi:nitrite reductase (NADH) large subunit
MIGDVSKAAYLMQVFDRGLRLPDERLSLLFDIGAPSAQVTFDEMPDNVQICNCNGVNKGAIVQCVADGKRSLKGVMESTRAGTGCGSCKTLVNRLVEWACKEQLDKAPSLQYYVPGIPLTKLQLVEAVRRRNLRSVSDVFNALADGKHDAESKPELASLLRDIWRDDEDKRDPRLHADIPNDGTF